MCRVPTYLAVFSCSVRRPCRVLRVWCGLSHWGRSIACPLSSRLRSSGVIHSRNPPLFSQLHLLISVNNDIVIWKPFNHTIFNKISNNRTEIFNHCSCVNFIWMPYGCLWFCAPGLSFIVVSSPDITSFATKGQKPRLILIDTEAYITELKENFCIHSIINFTSII